MGQRELLPSSTIKSLVDIYLRAAELTRNREAWEAVDTVEDL